VTTNELAPDSPRAEPALPAHRAGLYAPFLIGLALLLVWSGYWLHVAQAMHKDLSDTIGRLRAAGLSVTAPMSGVSGFPYRFSVDFGASELSQPEQGFLLTIDAMRLTVLPFDTDHVVAELGQKITLNYGSEQIEVALQAVRAGWQPVDRRRPKTSGLDVGLTAEQAVITRQGRYPFERLGLTGLTLNTRPGLAGEDIMRLVLHLESSEIAADWTDAPLLAAKAGPSFLAMELRNASAFAVDPKLDGLRFRVLGAEVDFGAFDLRLQGEALFGKPASPALSPDLIETGHVVVTIDDPARLKAGLLSAWFEQDTTELLALLTLMEQTPTARTQRVDWREGAAWWGDIRLGLADTPARSQPD